MRFSSIPYQPYPGAYYRPYTSRFRRSFSVLKTICLAAALITLANPAYMNGLIPGWQHTYGYAFMAIAALSIFTNLFRSFWGLLSSIVWAGVLFVFYSAIFAGPIGPFAAKGAGLSSLIPRLFYPSQDGPRSAPSAPAGGLASFFPSPKPLGNSSEWTTAVPVKPKTVAIQDAPMPEGAYFGRPSSQSLGAMAADALRR